MDVDAGHYHKEGILGHVANTHFLKLIVFKNSLVDALSAGSVLVDAFVLIAAAGNRSEVARIVLCRNMDYPSIRASGAVAQRTAGNPFAVSAVTFQRTSEFGSLAGMVIAVEYHLKAFTAARYAILIDGEILLRINSIGEIAGISLVDVYYRNDISVIKQKSVHFY